jgi:hypothetical protein
MIKTRAHLLDVGVELVVAKHGVERPVGWVPAERI